jgi:hypothetical protein
VRFAQQGFRNDRDFHASGGSFDGRAQAGASGANDENVVLVSDVLSH